VAVLERGPLLGRSQEWNISKKELEELVRVGCCSRVKGIDLGGFEGCEAEKD